MQAHLGNHRAKLARVVSYLNRDSLAMACCCVDPRFSSPIPICPPKADREAGRRHFTSTLLTARYEGRQTTDAVFAAKRVQEHHDVIEGEPCSEEEDTLLQQYRLTTEPVIGSNGISGYAHFRPVAKNFT